MFCLQISHTRRASTCGAEVWLQRGGPPRRKAEATSHDASREERQQRQKATEAATCQRDDHQIKIILLQNDVAYRNFQWKHIAV